MNDLPAVLVVDDDSAARAVLSLSLRRAGFPVLTAADGPEALGVLATRPVSVLITDGCMAPMDGFELSRRAKASRPGLRIAMLTALFTAADAAGTAVERVFTKPGELGSIVTWLQETRA